jgi:hypothetical protein
MLPLNHKRTTSSSAPPIFYAVKNWQLKDRKFTIDYTLNGQCQSRPIDGMTNATKMLLIFTHTHTPPLLSRHLKLTLFFMYLCEYSTRSFGIIFNWLIVLQAFVFVCLFVCVFVCYEVSNTKK